MSESKPLEIITTARKLAVINASSTVRVYSDSGELVLSVDGSMVDFHGNDPKDCVLRLVEVLILSSKIKPFN